MTVYPEIIPVPAGGGILVIHVYDKNTLKPVQGASIRMDTAVFISDSTGEVTIPVPTVPKLYVVEITHPNYETVSGSVYCDTELTEVSFPLIPTAVAPPPTTYVMAITHTAGGFTDPPAGRYTYKAGYDGYATAHPSSGYVHARWELDGVPQTPVVATIAVRMDRDHTVHAVFEALVPPPPPPVAAWTLTLTVTDAETGGPISGAACMLGTDVSYTDASGKAQFKGSEAVHLPLTVSAGGYETYSTDVTLKVGDVVDLPIKLTPVKPVDPWSWIKAGITAFFGALFSGLSDLVKGITAPIEAQIRDLVARATASLGPGSPDKEVEARTKALAEEIRKRQDEIIRRMYKRSPALELAPQVAAELLAVFLGTQVTVETGATVIDNVHPIRSTRIQEVAQRVIDSLGFPALIPAIALMPTRVGLLPQLEYWWNSQFTPLIPSLPDLIVMLVREVITPDEYAALAAMHGESKVWADRRWEAHWRLPAPEMVRDAYHRGIITVEERDRYMVLHDYKPSVRPGIKKTDLEIISGLQKELIPRVDLRRAWELGLIDDQELTRRYRLLGYEDDAPLMADIQKSVAVEGERMAVARAAGRPFRDRKISEADFRRVLKDLGIVGERQNLWILRYQWERFGKPTPEEEAAEERPPIPTEEAA